ncbi:MAG: SCO family protein, partial [Gammaproteobacteria bacterium]|nr:SCO family protein [Gammaproteobacteria bacterium]
MRRELAIVAAFLIPLLSTSAPAHDSLEEHSEVVFDGQEALRVSQAAVGRRLSDHSFLNRSEEEVSLSDYSGKPLLISLIYTSCYYSCSVFTRYLGEIVDVAREALGEGSFSVVTIGFDAVN